MDSSLSNQPPATTPSPTPPLSATPPVTPTSPPSIPPEKAEQPPVKKDINFLNAFLMVLGPLFMVGAFTFSLYQLKLSPQARQTASYPLEVVDSGVEIKTVEDYHKYAPDNPTEVKAYADSSKQTELESGQPYSYNNPYFEWSGAKTNEPKTKIIGYLVSFGENYDPTDPSTKLVKTNSFSPKEQNITLEDGKTYKLFVQSISNGKAPLGVDRENQTSATAIFEYVYKTESSNQSPTQNEP